MSKKRPTEVGATRGGPHQAPLLRPNQCMLCRQVGHRASGCPNKGKPTRALISGGRALGHTEECRIRVERELRKTEEGKARFRAAASRVGDTLTGCALKRVRFAEDQGDNNAEVPDPTSESAPSTLPAEAALSSSALALPASATEVPNQVMSEGASSSSLKLQSD